ncbi:MAG: TetR/AcrR family transcriptional regulator [Devosiaceae bacterium]|nr:TetR/AcrR family transcriptional regulator [Devosiaceae bacterium]
MMSDYKSTLERKKQIVKTVLELSYQHGAPNVSTNMIAQHLGITQPALYKHFKNKQEIWEEVATSIAKKISKNIAAKNEEKLQPITALKRLVLSHLELLRKAPALLEIMVLRKKNNEHSTFQKIIQNSMKNFHNALAQEVKRAVKEEEFDCNLCAKDASSLIMGLVQSLVLRMLIERNPDILSKNGERLLDLLLSGFTKIGTK